MRKGILITFFGVVLLRSILVSLDFDFAEAFNASLSCEISSGCGSGARVCCSGGVETKYT